ncbi:hypothetical protein [Nocardia sp. NRRL WC-3656]|uniref:hypothetical protein n=1 Tax=Nocardia sp. NRRL WC-3656 TaxID=1463824 RepID=UPI000A5DC09E|nr:hypothetical protein [Nocardia sp. NRRL WC-3656]
MKIDSATAQATRENSVAGHMNRAAGQAVGLTDDCAARAISSALTEEVVAALENSAERIKLSH